MNRAVTVPAILLLAAMVAGQAKAQVPAITGTPTIDTAKLLLWPLDQTPTTPNLSTPTADVVYDVHANLADCDAMDLVFSTEGNYNMALHDLWFNVLLPKYADDIQSWMYTTSPPISVAQTANNVVEVGNIRMHCRPSVAVAGLKVIKKLEAAGVTEGDPIPLDRTHGVVLLVKKGNPKHIHDIWDLGRKHVHVVTPNPTLEGGAFGKYLNTIYGVAANDPNPPRRWTAARLVNAVFNSGIPGKWLAGVRIHHRDVPWSVAYGHADVGLLHYHLALWTVQNFPNLFQIIPLGGTVQDPQPLPGNVISESYIIRIKGDWSLRQLRAREDLIDALGSDAFTRILASHGIGRP